MPIPDLTHMQFLALTSLGAIERSGRELRERMADEEGVKLSGPAFYQFMARLEDAKLVTGRYEQKVVDGQVIKERRYKVTGTGCMALRVALDFYQERAKSVKGLQHA